jgi:hypothetical protein
VIRFITRDVRNYVVRQAFNLEQFNDDVYGYNHLHSCFEHGSFCWRLGFVGFFIATSNPLMMGLIQEKKARIFRASILIIWFNEQRKFAMRNAHLWPAC